MKKLVVFFFVINSFSQVCSQHLPLQIGNQWHYNQGLGPVYPYAAKAVDTIQISNKTYFKIECREANTDSLLWTTYDRVDGDSLYFRLNYGIENLLFNFNWQNGQVIVSPAIFDTTCFHIQIIHRDTTTFWGIQTYFYNPEDGYFCPTIDPDTGWSLSGYSYIKYFGCFDCNDGLLVGSVINGITYGVLHPLPVELLSCSSSVNDNDVILNWTTATETNNSGFQIERREMKNERSEEWKTITFVNGNGTTTEPQTYFYKDVNLSVGKYQYRLKQIDFDGTFEYSNIVEAVILPPARFSLEQNYPNPFNPSTKIEYAIASSQFVSLKVFNALGQEVETLVNEYQEAGAHSKVYVVNSTLPSGVYYYQLKAGEFIQTRKMILLK